jgi:ProP effector
VDSQVADCAIRLKALFPALFEGPIMPLKLKIQADIQQRAPGQFTKQALSAFFRRFTGKTSYLILLTRAQHRFDLEGQPAGEISEEHRNAAASELTRRRANLQARRDQEDKVRKQHLQLLQDYEGTTLTRANFCALKGIAESELDKLLAEARNAAEKSLLQKPLTLHRRSAPSASRISPNPSASGNQRRASGSSK